MAPPEIAALVVFSRKNEKKKLTGLASKRVFACVVIFFNCKTSYL